MRCFRDLVLALITVCCFLFFPLHLVAAPEGEFIIISKKGADNIALVLDKLEIQGDDGSKIAHNLGVIIHDGLDFTSLFTLKEPPLHVKGKSGIDFRELGLTAAEVYAGGTVTLQAGAVTLSMKVYEIASSKLLFSKTYGGNEAQFRTLGHAFCADLVERLTGRRSAFGSKIVFVSTTTGFKEIYQCDFDGQGVEQLTHSRTISLTPALSPDGKYLAYTDYSTGRPALYIRNLHDGTTATAGKSGISIDPAWRNNSELATTLSFEGDQEIYLFKSNGALYRRVTKSSGIDLSPTFSPDGNKMAFVSERHGRPQIFIQDLLSGEVKRLTFNGEYNTQPSWSPAGDKIAYTTCENNGEFNIFAIGSDGSGLRQLTLNSGKNESPSWSPDGELIVFTSSREGGKKLYTMSSTGKNQRRLLLMKGEQMQPSWSLFRK
ncbi:MAG: Tol-Pal system beta propeller repeat protein TolB [Chlorobium sp.]